MLEDRRKWLALGLLVAAVGVWKFAQWWQQPAALEFTNLPVLQLLSTAVSSRNLPAVEKVAAVIDERHASQKMSDAEFREFDKLLKLVRAGEWEQADRSCFDLATAQLSRRRAVPAEDAGHSHSHAHP